MKQKTRISIYDIARKRAALIGQIAILNYRHRKRRHLQTALCKLTTQQLRLELKA
jgi:hypothetical protein